MSNKAHNFSQLDILKCKSDKVEGCRFYQDNMLPYVPNKPVNSQTKKIALSILRKDTEMKKIEEEDNYEVLFTKKRNKDIQKYVINWEKENPSGWTSEKIIKALLNNPFEL